MSQGLVERQHLQDIGDAIRSKNGSTDTYTPAEMAQAISGIHTADEVVLVQKTVNANGQYNASDDSADGYSGVMVNVPNSYSASDEGKVVSGGALVGQTSRNVTVNGTYDTTENNEVVVNVSGGGGESKVKIMNQGQVSDTSDYKTANFDNDVDFSLFNCLRFDLYRDGVVVGTSVVGNEAWQYNNNISFYIVGGGYTYTMMFYYDAKQIRCSRYSGNYVDLYVDVYGANI